MERLPQVKDFCDRAVRLVCSHVEQASFQAGPEQLRALRLVLSPRELAAVAEERCAQCRCGHVACDRPLEKQRLLSDPLRFNEASGDFEDRTQELHYCGRACFEAARAFEASLEPDPPYLRSGVVATVVRVARELGVGEQSEATIARLAQPLLPKPIVIAEEPERAAALPPVPAAAIDSEEVDVLSMMDWDEQDRHEQLRGVQVPLVPLVWDALGQWITADTRAFVARGELSEAMAEDRTSVADLQGRSLVQRRTRLSQALGPAVRAALANCEVEDPEDVALLIGRVDHLILSLHVASDRAVPDPAARFDYSNVVNAVYGSKGLRIMAAVFLAVLRPALTRALCEQLPGVQLYELEMLKDQFLG